MDTEFNPNPRHSRKEQERACFPSETQQTQALVSAVPCVSSMTLRKVHGFSAVEFSHL